MARSYGRCMFNFLRHSQLFSKVTVPFHNLSSSIWEFQCSTYSPTFRMVSLFNFRHSYRLVVVSIYSYDFLFCHCVCLFWLCDCLNHFLIFYWVVWFLFIAFWEFFIQYQFKSFIRYETGRYFLQDCSLSSLLTVPLKDQELFLKLSNPYYCKYCDRWIQFISKRKIKRIQILKKKKIRTS